MATRTKKEKQTDTKNLVCPKACVLNQLDDDRLSDTVVLETQKAIDATLTMLTNEGEKPSAFRRTSY